MKQASEVSRSTESGNPAAPYLARPTHRLQVWASRDAVPEVLELVVEGDVGRGLAGATVIERQPGGPWCWAAGDPVPVAIRLDGVPGRRPRGSAAATSQIGLRFPPARGKPGRYVAIRVAPEERDAIERAAGDQPVQAWILSQPGVTRRLGAGAIRRIALEAAGFASPG